MEKLGRSVTAYHPEIRVRRGDQVVAIKVDMDDFYDDGEVMGKLAASNPGCRTVGDLVLAIEGGKGELSQQASGVMACCIEECSASPHAADPPVRDWDEPI